MIPIKLYAVVVLLVFGDISTTFFSKMLLGANFGEIGLIANFLMSTVGDAWPVYMYPIEIVAFGLTTLLFSRSKNAISIGGKKKLSLTYLPVIALLSLIGNNLLHIVLSIVVPF